MAYRRPETDATEAKVYEQDVIGEFMTTWKDFPRPGLAAWSDRPKEGLMTKAKSTHFTPRFRPFDMIEAPNSPLVVIENANHRIGVESVVGVQDQFHRYVDSDMIYFQFAGSTTVESEFGVYEVGPGEVILIPGGISHRSTGRDGSLRWFCQTVEAVDKVMGQDQYTSDITYTLERSGGPDWKPEAGKAEPTKGAVIEHMHFWNDGPDDLTELERDYDFLVGVSRLRGAQEGASGVKVVRAFDHYTTVVGKGGADMGTQPLMEAAHLRIQTYNMEDEQFAFHRALQSEEIRVQFRGDALDMSEFQNVEVSPGEITIIPLGIAHSVITIPPEATDFLRLNFYSTLPWKVLVDPTKHLYESTFEVTTNIHRESDWKISREADATKA
jgi:mannose-6-phosphate isomerase-like protein (cupin superfamily)